MRPVCCSLSSRLTSARTCVFRHATCAWRVKVRPHTGTRAWNTLAARQSRASSKARLPGGRVHVYACAVARHARVYAPAVAHHAPHLVLAGQAAQVLDHGGCGAGPEAVAGHAHEKATADGAVDLQGRDKGA
jgi:hypothetical protein